MITARLGTLHKVTISPFQAPCTVTQQHKAQRGDFGSACSLTDEPGWSRSPLVEQGDYPPAAVGGQVLSGC